MAAPSQTPFDWEIDAYQFKLAPREITGQRPHDIAPIPYLAQQISSTAELTTADISREVEVAFAMDGFYGGLAEAVNGTTFNLESQRRIRWSKNCDTSFRPYALPGPKVTTIGSTIAVAPTLGVQRGDITYIAAGANLYQVTTSGATLDTTFGTTITDLFVWGGFLLIGLGDSAPFRYRSSDSGVATEAAIEGRFFEAINDILYVATQPNTLSTAQAVTGPWAEYDVGDSSYDITGLVAAEQVIVVNKEDGPYIFDQDVVAQPLVPELRLQSDAHVGEASCVYNRDLYFTTRLGLVRWRPGEGLRNVGLDLLADPQLPDDNPQITSVATDGRFLYALCAPSGTEGVYIWKRDYNDTWHNYLWRSDLGADTFASSDLLFVTNKIASTAINAVIFAYQSSSGNYQLAYARFPATSDPTNDPDYTFEDTAGRCSIRTLDYVASLLTVEKYSDRCKVVGSDLFATRKVTVTAYPDGEATAKTVGTFDESPFSEETLRKPLNYHFLAVNLALDGEDDTPPKLRGFHLSAAFLSRVVRRHTCQFLASSVMPLGTGGRARSDHNEIVNTFRELRKTRAAVKCRDEHRREFTAYLDEIVEWDAVPRTPGTNPVTIITATLKEVVV